MRQKRNSLWWYFLIAATTSEIVDLTTGAYGIAHPHLLVIIAGIASFGQQSFADEIYLYTYILIANVGTSILLSLFVFTSIDKDQSLSKWHVSYTNEYWKLSKRWSTLPAIFIFIATSSWMSYVGHKLHRQERKIRARANKLTNVWKSRLEFTDTVLGTSLPQEIVRRIDMTRNVNVYVGIADHVSQASVSFIKLCGISEAFRLYSTVEAVGLLGKIYKKMDQLCDQYFVEKIKTIGDTYMSVCGVPTPRQDHAQYMAQFCFAAVDVINKFSQALLKKSSGEPLHIVSKIGLACGPLVAGVIGRKNYTYDIWGDAVNTASRMYSSGTKGKIQTTSLMESKLSSQFVLERRGRITVKGKGDMTTYYLIKPKSHLDENLLIRKRLNTLLGDINHSNDRDGKGRGSNTPKITRQNLIRVKSDVFDMSEYDKESDGSNDSEDDDNEYNLPVAVNDSSKDDDDSPGSENADNGIQSLGEKFKALKQRTNERRSRNVSGTSIISSDEHAVVLGSSVDLDLELLNMELGAIGAIGDEADADDNDDDDDKKDTKEVKKDSIEIEMATTTAATTATTAATTAATTTTTTTPVKVPLRSQQSAEAYTRAPSSTQSIKTNTSFTNAKTERGGRQRASTLATHTPSTLETKTSNLMKKKSSSRSANKRKHRKSVVMLVDDHPQPSTLSRLNSGQSEGRGSNMQSTNSITSPSSFKSNSGELFRFKTNPHRNSTSQSSSDMNNRSNRTMTSHNSKVSAMEMDDALSPSFLTNTTNNTNTYNTDNTNNTNNINNRNMNTRSTSLSTINGSEYPFDHTEQEFLKLYRCCSRSQSHEVYRMDDEFLHYRNTTLRHYLQTTWIWIMFTWMIGTRIFESTLVLYLDVNVVSFSMSIGNYIVGPGFLLFLLIHAKNAHYDWKWSQHQGIEDIDDQTEEDKEKQKSNKNHKNHNSPTSPRNLKTIRESRMEKISKSGRRATHHEIMTHHLPEGGHSNGKQVFNPKEQDLTWATACHWCGGPRGKCCIWFRTKMTLPCLRILLCHVCCTPNPPEKLRNKNSIYRKKSILLNEDGVLSVIEEEHDMVMNHENLEKARMEKLVAAAVQRARGDQIVEQTAPIRCCCLGEERAFTRVQMSRCLVWVSLSLLSIGLSIQASFVDVVYSYWMFIILILMNQFSSLVHSDEVVLTLFVVVVYNVLMTPGPAFTCCNDDITSYDPSVQCISPIFEWCSRKALDGIRLHALHSAKSDHNNNVSLSGSSGSISSMTLQSRSSMTASLGAIIMTHGPSNTFNGSWLLTFNVDRLFPVLFLVLACGQQGAYRARKLFLHHSHVIKQQEMIKLETKRHEELLTLPKEIWHLNTSNVNRVIDSYGSILFADIVSFTVFSTIVNPMELVLVLNEMFQLFDKAAQFNSVKKIKTLGDCYVASSGILEVTSDHASNLISFGLDMHDQMVVLQEIPDLYDTFVKLRNNTTQDNRLRIRVGINSGSVVGGVVGDKKAQFDVWGDTVEIANFMESEGVPDRVHISHATYLRSRHKRKEENGLKQFIFEPLGKMDLKECGIDDKVETFLVDFAPIEGGEGDERFLGLRRRTTLEDIYENITNEEKEDNVENERSTI